MLERLTIRDLALVERAEIAFGTGLHAVTGETGAGKSLMVEALALAIGGRGGAGGGRGGAKGGVVQAGVRGTPAPPRPGRGPLPELGRGRAGATSILRPAGS